MKDALLLIAAGLATLAIAITASIITVHIERPHAQQATCTVTTALRG